MKLIKWILLGVASGLSVAANAACTIQDQPINFGTVAYSAPVGTITTPVTVTVTCPSGEAFTIKPNAASGGNLILTVLREGVNNGTQYLYFLNPGGTLMKSGAPASLVSGVGTGAPQSFNLTAVMSGNTSSGTLLAVNKTGVFSATMKLLQVTSTTTVTSANQTVNGDIEGQCTISSGNMSYGTIPTMATSQTITSATNINVTCDNSLAYTMLSDSSNARWTYNAGMSIDVAYPPRPADPATFKLDIRPLGGGAGSWTTWGPSSGSKTSSGTGSTQTWEVRGTLTISANWTGVISSTIYPKIVF